MQNVAKLLFKNIILLALFSFCFSLSTFAQEHTEAEEEGELFIDVKAGAKNSIFKNNDNIEYSVKMKSTYKKAQDGKFSYIVTTDDGKKVYEKSVNMKIGGHGSHSERVSVPSNKPGFYHINFMVNLSFYDDTVRRVFGINPERIVSKPNKPADFDAFWQKSKDILAKIPPKYTITEPRNMSTKDVKVYLIEMRSWDNALIKGWLTIPLKKRPKKLPVRYRVPGYLVEMKPSMFEDDFAVFQINVRGNGNSKDAINTRGEQYNLFNITDKDNYVYRAVYMDCIRGLDFINDNAEKFGFDTKRISIDGGSQGGCLAVVVAALDKRISAVTTEVPLYSDFRNASRITRMYPPKGETPIYYLNNYVKNHSGFGEERVFKVWDYYDPINFAPKVKVPVLMGIGLLDDLCPPSCSVAMFNQLGTKDKEVWMSADKAHEVDPIYYRFQYVWLREKLLLP